MTTFERIKQTAKQRGLTLNQLNDKAQMKHNVIYSWKTKTPSSDKLKAVADVLGVSVDYLLGNTDDPTTKHATNESQPAELSEILSEESLAMFDGQPLSDEYKRALLAMLRANRGQ